VHKPRLGMEFRRLLDTFHAEISGEHDRANHLHPAAETRAECAFRQHASQSSRTRSRETTWICSASFCIAPKVAARSCTRIALQAYSSQHAQFVFAEALLRIANGANDSRLKIRANRLHNRAPPAQRIEQHPVDGEIPPRHILRGSRLNAFIRMAAVGVANITAEVPLHGMRF